MNLHAQVHVLFKIITCITLAPIFFSSVDTDTVFFLYKKRSPSHLVKIEIYFC